MSRPPTVEIPVAIWDLLAQAATVARAIRITRVGNGKIAIGGGLDPLFFVRGEAAHARCGARLGDLRCTLPAGHATTSHGHATTVSRTRGTWTEAPEGARGVQWGAPGEDTAARQCPSRRGDYHCQRTSGHTGAHQADDDTGTTYWSPTPGDTRCLAQHESANCQKVRGHLGPHAGYTRGPLLDWPEPEPEPE